MNLRAVVPVSEATIAVETLSPEVAEQWLATSPGNRTISKKHVAVLAEEMSSGRWKARAATFAFNTSGGLLDGHQRCHAVIKSGVTIEALVNRGVDPDWQQCVGIVRKESAPDILMRAGTKNSNQHAAAGSVVIQLRAIECGTAYSMAAGSTVIANSSAIARAFLGDQALAYWVGRCLGFSRGHMAVSDSELAGFLYWIQKDPARYSGPVHAFAHQVLTGENLQSGNPIFALRRRLLDQKLKVGGMRHARFVALAKCWNAYCTGTSVFKAFAGRDEDLPPVVKM